MIKQAQSRDRRSHRVMKLVPTKPAPVIMSSSGSPLKYMLDTNIVIYTIKNKPKNVRTTFNARKHQMCISTITWMELMYGAHKSIAPHRNQADIEKFTNCLSILPYDKVTADYTGKIRARLAKIGKPIGPYDQMIAGHAQSLALILVSNNIKEFERVPDILLENWVT